MYDRRGLHHQSIPVTYRAGARSSFRAVRISTGSSLGQCESAVLHDIIKAKNNPNQTVTRRWLMTPMTGIYQHLFIIGTLWDGQNRTIVWNLLYRSLVLVENLLDLIQFPVISLSGAYGLASMWPNRVSTGATPLNIDLNASLYNIHNTPHRLYDLIARLLMMWICRCYSSHFRIIISLIFLITDQDIPQCFSIDFYCSTINHCQCGLKHVQCAAWMIQCNVVAWHLDVFS